MKFFTALAVLLFTAFASAQSPPFSSCATGSTNLAFTSVTLSPYPLCIGQAVCITILGPLSAPITSGGPLTIEGRYLGRVVYSSSYDLCTVLSASGHSCPIPVTVTSITICVIVGSMPPGIAIALVITAINGDGSIIFSVCATVTATSCPT